MGYPYILRGCDRRFNGHSVCAWNCLPLEALSKVRHALIFSKEKKALD